MPPSHLGGVLLGSVGALLTTRDAPSAIAAADADATSSIGDIAAIIAGLGAAFYLKTAEKARLAVDPLVFFAVVQLQFVGYCLAASILLDSRPPSLDVDVDDGILGWPCLLYTSPSPRDS